MKTSFMDLVNFVTTNEGNPFDFGRTQQLQKVLEEEESVYLSRGVEFALKNKMVSSDDIINMFSLFLGGNMGVLSRRYNEKGGKHSIFLVRGMYVPENALFQYNILDEAMLTIQYMKDGEVGDGIDGFCMCFTFERDFMRLIANNLMKDSDIHFPDSFLFFLTDNDNLFAR